MWASTDNRNLGCIDTSNSGGDNGCSPKCKIVLLWDMLKVPKLTLICGQMKLRKSEEDEMARLIGTEVIEKLEVTIIINH